MTTSYSLKVADARFGGFVRLLFRWQASFYKLLYKELLVYLALYFALSATYRLVLNGRQREYFEDISLFCNKHTDLIPVAFLLGFYVSVVFTRWWQQYTCIPWPDRIAALIGCSVHGDDHRGRLIRRTLVRYVNLATLLIMRSISTAVYKRFPTMHHVVEAGFMTPPELKDYDQLDSPHNKFWLPLNWFCNLVTKCRREGRVQDPYTFRTLIEESNSIRGSLAMLYSYDWISVPLVYTQVVTVAVYTFFLSCLMGRQWLDPTRQYPGYEVDLYVPIFTILQFLFYMGWLKVAEQLINPFGQDDDDFETNWCIDRNLQISYLAVDDLYMTNPTLEQDIYWNQPDPDLPYTEASISNRVMTEPFLGSTFDMRLNVHNMEFTSLPTVPEEPGEKRSDSNNSLHSPAGPAIVVTEKDGPSKTASVPRASHSASAPSSPLLTLGGKNAGKGRGFASPRCLRKALLTSKTRAKMESPLELEKLDRRRPVSWGGREGGSSALRDNSVVSSTEDNMADITNRPGETAARLEVRNSQWWAEEHVWLEDEGKPLLSVQTNETHADTPGARGHLQKQDGGPDYASNTARGNSHVPRVDSSDPGSVQRLTVV
ncbi:PREDICTED: bestrophin-2-like isoform X2 [Branchiostoma belcheri]|uniref:Bestrophin homolog n=1 Tax=Branchiostoma belcheri TaxID=7741 RepID=A0A6P4XH37_BRABE|nr:PREDICTED: bestrophin-2-like isoform X2 [Branchiostoma belcheri]